MHNHSGTAAGAYSAGVCICGPERESEAEPFNTEHIIYTSKFICNAKVYYSSRPRDRDNSLASEPASVQNDSKHSRFKVHFILAIFLWLVACPTRD